MDTDCVLVFTTLGASANVQAFATTLVTERLAACVNVLGTIDSVYRWKGAVESEREQQLLIKTTADRISALEIRLHELHSYEVPEFLVLPIVGGSERYLGWVRESTVT